MVAAILGGLGVWRMSGVQLTTSASVEDQTAQAAPVAAAPLQPAPLRARFSIRYKGLESPFSVSSVLLMPGEGLTFEAVSDSPSAVYSVEAVSGLLTQQDASQWSWTAPLQSGIYPVQITRAGALPSSITLNALVKMPHRPSQSAINGYPIGYYPKRPYRNNPVYLIPEGLVEVTEANQDTPLTPHFRLGQFVCKQEAGFPKYVVLNERLLLKLELILEEMNRAGHRIDTFQIMSGYRTPAYNKSLKNVQYSLHQWGVAADIYVDQSPRDEFMDDLNKDGRIDYRDAQVISSVIARMDQTADFQPYKGGLGGYKTGKFGPFVHVDVRGWDARWGVQPKLQSGVTTVALR